MASDEELIRLLRLCAERAHRMAMEEWGGLIPELTVEGRTEWLAADRLQSLLTQNQKMREALEQVERLRVYCEVEGVDMPMNRLQEAIEGRCFPREAEPLPKATI